MTTSLLSSVTPPPKSKAGQLADLLPGIEAALAKGHSHIAILEYLKNTLALDLTYSYYQLTLHRIRKKRTDTAAETSRPPTLPTAVRYPTRDGSSLSHSTNAPTEQLGNKFKYDVKAPIDDFFS